MFVAELYCCTLNCSMLAARMPTVCLLSASIFIIVILTAPSYTTQAWYSMTPPLRRVSIKGN